MLTSLKTHLNNFSFKHPLVTQLLTTTCLGFILTTLFTWPMFFHLSAFFSDESDYTLIGWIMWYNQLSFTTGRILSPTDYFNAFQFYPWPYSLAFSEHMFIPAVLFSPVYWISNQLVLSVNLYTFSSFILTFISSFYAFYKILKDKSAGLIAAVIFTFNPVTAAHFPGHTHLLGKFFLPLLLLTSIHFFSSPNLKKSFYFGLFFTLNALTAITFFIISVPSLLFISFPFFVFHLINGHWTYFKKILLSSIGFLIFLPLLYFFLFPYKQFSILEGAQRGVSESVFFSAEPIDWFLAFPESLLYKNAVAFFDNLRTSYPKINYSEHTLGLNIIPVILCLIGLFYLRKQNQISILTIFSLLSLFIGTFIFTFGPLWETYKLPYFYFNEVTGLLNGIRVPTRFQFFFYLPFALFAGLGYLAILKKYNIKPMILFILIITLITLENTNKWNFINDTSAITSNNSAMFEYRSLTFLNNKTTLHLPAYSPNYEKQIYYLLISTIHSERLVNGYSGYFPTDWSEFIDQLNTSLNLEMFNKLNALNVDYLVIHKDRFTDTELIEKIINDQSFSGAIVYNSSIYLIVDLQNPRFKTTRCSLAKDINLTIQPMSQSYGLKPIYYQQIQLTNNSDCYFVNILNERYLQSIFFINGKEYPTNIKLPVIVGPMEEKKIQ